MLSSLGEDDVYEARAGWFRFLSVVISNKFVMDWHLEYNHMLLAKLFEVA